MSEEKSFLENFNEERNFASRYLVVVSIAPEYIVLSDTIRCKYYIDKENCSCVEQFKVWFNKVLSLGITGKLTLFEYKKVENDGQIINIIEKFFESSLTPNSSSL